MLVLTPYRIHAMVFYRILGGDAVRLLVELGRGFTGTVFRHILHSHFVTRLCGRGSSGLMEGNHNFLFVPFVDLLIAIGLLTNDLVIFLVLEVVRLVAWG